MRFEIKNACCGYGREVILNDISLSVESGNIFCLLGPNGVGKTTLFKSMLGFLKPLSGEVLINGENIAHWSASKLARVVGYVPQVHTPPFPYTVLDVVTMGCIAQLGAFGIPGKQDIATAEENLERLDISYLRDKIYTEISGGERQMVLIARALAQKPQILVMDEPTANLDFGNQVRVLTCINRLAEDGLTVIMTSHFPDHAFLCSSEVGLIKKDSTFLVGRAEAVVTEEHLRSAYGVDVRIIREEIMGVGLLKSCVPVMG